MKKQMSIFLLLPLIACGGAKEKLSKFVPLEKDLTVYASDGSAEQTAVFRRAGAAALPDFTKAANDVPRFTGGGLLMECGGKTDERGALNFLPPGWKPGDAVPVKLGKTHVFSFYAKGSGEVTATVQPGNIVKKFPLSGETRRFHIPFEPKAGDSFSVKFDPETLPIERPMLEGPCVYFGQQEPSSYIEPGDFREADKLYFPFFPSDSEKKGAIAFDFAEKAKGSWQSLVTIGSGWKNDLDISLYRDKWPEARVTVLFRGKTINSRIKLDSEKKHNYIFSWTESGCSLWVDGKKIMEEKNLPSVPFSQKNLYLGSRSTQVGANGIFSNLAVFSDSLDDAEAEGVAADSGKLAPEGKTVSRLTPFSVFPVNAGKVEMLFSAQKEIVSIRAAPGRAEAKAGVIRLEFDPFGLEPGPLTIALHCVFADGTKEEFSFPVRLTPPARPWKNLQISAWNEGTEGLEKYGVTIAGSGTSSSAIDDLALRGLYGSFNYNDFGKARPTVPEDSAVDSFGNLLYPDARSYFIKNDVEINAKNLMKHIHYAPTFKAIVINSERHAGGAGHQNAFNFSENERKIADGFGLDLEKWRLSGKNDSVFRKFQPIGWLATYPAPELVPTDGIVRKTNPLYAYLCEKHSASGASEVVLNDIIAETILSSRPDMLAMQDPILRRPALRSYRKVNVAQDWFYYPDLSAATVCTELLGTVIRGNAAAVPSAMPQFLFKAGMAAPFDGMPTPDMLREACRIVLSRPARVLSFWNIGNAFRKGKSLSPEEIVRDYGNGGYAETEARIKASGKTPFCFVPGLDSEFAELSRTLFEPFGALFPQWRNAPRKLAIVRSFASDLFGNVRWAGFGTLANAVVASGMPFDVLYDSDLDSPLGGYDAIVLSGISALPESGVKNLEKFAKEGGTLIADSNLKIQSLREKAVVIDPPAPGNINEAALKKLLDSVRGDVSAPVYVEAVQELAAKANAASASPELRKCLSERVGNLFSTDAEHLFWNHLFSGKNQFLTVVNDLRIPGEVYGRFGKISEKGLPQKVVFRISGGKVRFAYDLESHRELPFDGKSLTLDLPPCGGRIILFTEKPLGELSVKNGRIRMDGLEGLVPVEVANRYGNYYDVLPPEGLDAENLFSVRELASGKTLVIKGNKK